MLTVSSSVLSLSAEAAVLVRAGRVVYANPAALVLLGADCIGKTVAALFGNEIAHAQASAFTAETALAGKRCVLRTAQKDDVQVLFFSPLEDAPGQFSDAFLCSLRSSLMNCRLSCELGRDRAERYGDAELDASFAAMQRASLRVARLLDNCALLRSLAANELVLSAEAIELVAFCRYLLDGVAALAPSVRFTLHADGELWLLADRALLRQMILNLISNCLVHAAPLQTVSISLLGSASRVILSVSDDGCGIGEEAMSTVFERYRDGYALSDMGRGAGLGLSLVRGVAREHGGTLMLESRAGSGTSARVSLARRVSPSALGTAAAETPADMGALLTGLADCLPPECFAGKYLD